MGSAVSDAPLVYAVCVEGVCVHSPLGGDAVYGNPVNALGRAEAIKRHDPESLVTIVLWTADSPAEVAEGTALDLYEFAERMVG